MQLFQPNNLSIPRPEFVPVVDPDLTNEISLIVRREYELSDSQQVSLSRPVGANVSTENFVVKFGDSRFFVKRREAERRESLLREAQLAFELSARGLRVAKPFFNTQGNLLYVDDHSCVVVYQFEDGNYFSGQGRELDSAAVAFGALTRAAVEIFNNDSHASADDSFLKELTALLDEAKTIRNQQLSPLVELHYDTVLKHLAEVSEHNRSIHSHWLPVHLDYHPLNLLMKDEEVSCILDFEHLKVYPLVVGLGFAGYKLTRQAMVHEVIRKQEMTTPTLLTRWLNGWQTTFADLTFSPQQLGVGARYQELFLIHLILDAFLRKSDSRFLYDLEKHLISLHEIDAIISLY